MGMEIGAYCFYPSWILMYENSHPLMGLLDQIARKLEAVNMVKEPLQSKMLNGKWELIYTTSKSVLQTEVRKFPTFMDFIFWLGGPGSHSLNQYDEWNSHIF